MEPYVYQSLNEVPEAWRKFKGARLNINQVNEIIADAYKNAISDDTPDYGGSKKRFSEIHIIEQGFWVSKEKE